jgi:hypothetical protein
VISTSSAPETVLRLLGGRYEASATRERLAKWRLFDPVLLASFGVERPFADAQRTATSVEPHCIVTACKAPLRRDRPRITAVRGRAGRQFDPGIPSR